MPKSVKNKTPYVFFRKDVFYVVDLANDELARHHALANHGTLKVQNVITKEIVWEKSTIYGRKLNHEIHHHRQRQVATE